MRLEFSAFFTALLLKASVSSAFATPAASHQKLHAARNGFGARSIPFVVVPRGGGGTAATDSSSTSLFASTTTAAVVSDANLQVLSERGRSAVQKLVESDPDGYQAHVYGDWPEAGTDDEGKKRLAEQVGVELCFCLADLDSSYPGGLEAYLSKARVLLKESADGVNPFEDFEASVPEGEILSYDGEGTMPFSDAEQAGIAAMPGAVFVLVAGGLGERLGYSGIKLSLETNLCTNECYLEVYARYIQAMQYLAPQTTGNNDIRIPLVIMTSGATDELTRKLLKDNNNFGMEDDMVTIVMQDKVPALKDGNAGLALDDSDRWSVQTKPHGHGDVHHLLYREGLVDKWVNEGKTHVVFLQDTNAL
ncbi:MAG: hypothetical protein SGARI_003602, partial [Bacillariaceae sp.]